MDISRGDLTGHWSLSFSVIEFLAGKPVPAWLGLAAQLKFFAAYGFFVKDPASIPADGVEYLAEQLGFDVATLNEYDFAGCTARRHCAEILKHLGFRRMKRVDREELTSWIADELCPTGQSAGAMLDQVFLWCRDRVIYGPSLRELERLVRSRRQHYLDSWLIGTGARLSGSTVALLEASIADEDGVTGFNTMRGDAGQASLDNRRSTRLICALQHAPSIGLVERYYKGAFASVAYVRPHRRP